jgi:hypothetical protein
LYFWREQLYGSAQPSGRRSEHWLANAVKRDANERDGG